MTNLINNKAKKITTLIPIRKGSKGLKFKNILKLKGIPLYQHAINQALRISDECIISTDIPSILNKENIIGLKIIKRSKKLSTDNSPMSDVILNVIKTQKLIDNIIILLQATSPLRLDSDIKSCISLYKSGLYSMVMSVTQKDSGCLKYGFIKNNEFKPIINTDLCFKNRQLLPNIYGPNGAIYIFSGNDFIDKKDFPSQKIGFHEMPVERSLDIDTALDMKEAEKRLDLNFADQVNH